MEGIISGIPDNGFLGKKNGEAVQTGKLITNNFDYYRQKPQVNYGIVVEDEFGEKYFLRDDFLFRQAKPMSKAPKDIPTLKDSFMNGTILYAAIYNDKLHGKKDGSRVKIHTNWREPPVRVINHMGGQLMRSDRGTYYLEREQSLWPPLLSSENLTSIRERLPMVGVGKTVRDVLSSEEKLFGAVAKETIGPCLSMPRLLYGSHENQNDPSWVDMAPEGFVDGDFVTLRYRWHAKKDAFEGNLFPKVIVDVSRMTMRGKAYNIHTPWPRHCRIFPPRYSSSIFRVVSVVLFVT